MHAWEAIQKTVDYIETHLTDALEIEKLADMAMLSQFYYQRLFARLVKKPVKEYIKLRRLARSCERLLDKANRIADVAAQYGFINHETFTRAFKSTYKITPEYYRLNTPLLDDFTKPDLILNYVMVDEGVPLISEGLVLEYNKRIIKNPITFVGVGGYYQFKYGKMLGERPGISEPDAVWKQFFAIKKDIEHKSNALIIGVSYPGDAKEGFSSYFVGIESEMLHPQFDTWVLPAREYLICGFEAESKDELTKSALGKAMKHTRFWLREHGLTADGFFPEIYLSHPNKVAYMEMWIPFKKRENK